MKHSIFFTFFVPIVLIAENVDWKPILTPYIGSSFVMPEEHEYWSMQGRTHDSKAVSSQPSLIDIACQQKSNKICMQEQATQAKYAMSFAYKQQLLSLSYADFLKKVTSQESLSDEQILMLWNEFKDKRCWNYGNEKTDYENKLKEFLGDRKVKRLRQQQIKDAQERLLQQQQAQSLTQRQKPYVDIELLFAKESSFYAKRTQALAQTAQEGYQKYEASHAVDAQTLGYLESINVATNELFHVHGTTMQHQLISEVISSYKKVAKSVFEYGLKSLYLGSDVIMAAEVAREATMHDEIAMAACLSDLSDSLAQATIELGQMAVENAEALYYIGTHPFQTVKIVAAPFVRFVGFVGKVYASPWNHDLFLSARKDLEAFDAQCAACIDVFNNMSIDEKCYGAVKNVANLYLFNKYLGFIGSVYKHVKHARYATSLCNVIEESSVIEAIEEYLIPTELPCVATSAGEIEASVASLIEAEAQNIVYNMPPIMARVEQVLHKFGQYKGVIPFVDKQFASEMNVVLKQLENHLKSSALNTLNKQYGRRIIDGKQVKLLLDHVYNFELGLKKSRDLDGYILNISGGHLFGVCEALEKIGLVKIIGKELLSGGSIHYKMNSIFTNRLIEKTVFPCHWTEEKIAQAVWDIYCNDSAISICDNGKLTKRGFVDECELKIYWDSIINNNKIIDEIVTGLPVKK
ncbi:hypothetical protein KBD08_02165 [Candidatus Babeliales bacterium]|nr:hypothetical protein [Candidatus Babeliales bacterium]